MNPPKTCDLRFLLTRPSRDVTEISRENLLDFKISTHTPLAGRDMHQIAVEVYLQISTHTPLAGRDFPY